MADDKQVGRVRPGAPPETAEQPTQPPKMPPDGQGRQDAPDSGEIEWAEGFIAVPPAPGEVRVDPAKAKDPDQ